jgi:hypothetical protein
VTFCEIHDRSRTDTQYEAVWRVMLDGQKHQLEELQSRIISVFGVRAEAAKHDKPLADFLVRVFKQSLDQLPSRPRNAKSFTKAIRDEVLAAIEKHLDAEAASAGWSKTPAAANADLVGFGDEQRIEI